MIPPRIASGFLALPEEMVGLCRPHPWPELVTPPAPGMRAIRDILVHMISAEAYWIDHVVRGQPRQRLDPAAFPDLEAILSRWLPQRRATLAFLQGLNAADRTSPRPFPWNTDQSATVEEIAWHVVTHEQYHRGQIFTRLALLGRRDLPDHDLLR